MFLDISSLLISKRQLGIKPLFEIWSNIINSDNLFRSTENEEKEPILLSLPEQSDLYEILALDKVFLSLTYNNEIPRQKYSNLTYEVRGMIHKISFFKQV